MRTRFFRCQIPLMIATGMLPLSILLCNFWASNRLLPWLVAPACYLVLACVCMLLPGKWRLAVAIPGIIGMLAASYAALAGESIGSRVIIPAAYLILILFTLPVAGWERGREPPPALPAVCLCAHLLTQFLLFLKPSPFPAVKPMLMISFILFLLLFMLSLNRQSMASAMPDSHSVPVSIRRRNRLLTCVLLGITLLISTIPVLAKIAEQVLTWLKVIIWAIVEWLMNLLANKSTSGGSGGGAEDMLSGLGTNETSLLAKILEKIFVVIAVIVIVFAVLWTIRFLWRKLRQLLRFLYAQIRHYASTASEDYVDEVEDTREQGEEHFGMAQRFLRRRNAQRNLKDLPPREQIRTRYGLMRGKHPEWEQSATARETLNEASARLYEKARYSSHEITAKDSEDFAGQQSK